jgi:hypothetical protein
MAVDAERRTVFRGVRAYGLGVGAKRIADVLGPRRVLPPRRNIGDPAAFWTGDHSAAPSIRRDRCPNPRLASSRRQVMMDARGECEPRRSPMASKDKNSKKSNEKKVAQKSLKEKRQAKKAKK